MTPTPEQIEAIASQDDGASCGPGSQGFAPQPATPYSPAGADPSRGWFSISSAPRDGTVFIARNADHKSFGEWPMMRSVRHILRDGAFEIHDNGAWLEIRSNFPDYDEWTDTAVGHHVPFGIAPDYLNASVRYEWRSICDRDASLDEDAGTAAEPRSGGSPGPLGIAKTAPAPLTPGATEP